jgi:hypothetical protein
VASPSGVSFPLRWLPLAAFVDPGGGKNCGERDTSVGGDKDGPDTVKIRRASNFHRGRA